jgi:hypothetical protein
MAAPEDTRYRVRLSVPRSGGWRAWGQVSGRFERLLAQQQSAAVAGAHIESETRRGRDYVRVTISVAVRAPDVAHALATAWWVFRKAASDDAAGWDMAAATAEVQPEARLSGPVEGQHARGGRGSREPHPARGRRVPYVYGDLLELGRVDERGVAAYDRVVEVVRGDEGQVTS